MLKKSIWRKWTPGKSLELFERECKTLKHLKHPGIPRFIAAWSHEGNEEQAPEAVLVQEYIPRKNLQQWLEDGRRFTETEALELALQMCEILSYLHGFSPPVIHRDIKPGNVILDDKQRLFLIDFGAVKQTLTNQSQSVTMIGTFGYMPLEQMEGKSLPASNLFLLPGCHLGLSFKRAHPGRAGAKKPQTGFSSPHPIVESIQPNYQGHLAQTRSQQTLCKCGRTPSRFAQAQTEKTHSPSTQRQTQPVLAKDKLRQALADRLGIATHTPVHWLTKYSQNERR